MLPRFLFVLMALSGLACRAKAVDYTFDYNVRCRQAYNAYLALRPDEGDAIIRAEFAANPRNLMATYLADYGDFIWLFFNGDPVALKQRQAHQSERLNLLDRGSNEDPWKRFCKAGIYMHWAIIHGRFGEQFKATTIFRKSYLLIKENKERFPSFAQNDIFLGVEEAVAGTIPDEYKWLAAIFGMKGNVRRGSGRLTAFLSEHPGSQTPLRQEAALFDLYIRFYLLYRQQDVWRSVTAGNPQGNALQSFVYANIALNYRRAAPALAQLQKMINDPAWAQFPVFEYELANAQYLSLDRDCIHHFRQYAARNKGQLYTKDALMKCALFYHLEGNSAQAWAMRRLIKGQGNGSTDADKQAQRFAEGTTWPNAPLLKARIQTEAGNYAAALGSLRTMQPQAFTDPADRLEYTFRIARAYDGLGDALHAVQYYQASITEGSGRKEQFAARAALQLGMLYENGGRRDEALRYFRQCLAMKGHDFQSSIDQQAKAGVNRLTVR
jgi:tetratricopeptide (TPR) repeat protein